MKVSVLGSGSDGNAILVEAGETRVLVDAGFSGRDLERRLDALDVPFSSIRALVVTHDHRDHTRGMGVIARRHDLPVHLTDATLEACASLFRGGETVIPYRAGVPFEIGAVRVEPFLTCHDAADPVAVAVRDAGTGAKLGVATDLGRPTAAVRHALSGSDVLVLEANHDEVMLHEGPYPWSVKSRISSSHGHLSNRAAATLATELHHPGLAAVILAHLSDTCNTPERARAVIEEALTGAGFRGRLEVATQDEPLPLLDVEELRRAVGPDQLAMGL